MPIKNKDGSLYKIQGVNPLMKNQDHWHREEWKVHYVSTEEVIIQDPKRIIPEFLPDPVASIIGVGIIQQTEIIYCLPLIMNVEEDPLYGQKQKITSWGEKFNFEAIKVEYTGVTAVFFARIPPIEPGSILLEFKERQWWKVNGIEPSKDGINIYCMPSELKPSFI